MGGRASNPTRLSREDVRRVQSIEHRLRSVGTVERDEGGVIPGWLEEELRDLLALELFLACRPSKRADGTWTLDERVSRVGMAFWDRYEDAISAFPLPFHYDPLRPERRQRNRVCVRDDLCDHPPDDGCVVDVVWPGLGLGHHDQIRVLVCEGHLLLAWIGGYRQEPFSARDQAVLAALLPALGNALPLRRRLVDAALVRDGFEAAVTNVATPVFLVGRTGRIEHVNEVAAEMLHGEEAATRARVAAALEGTHAAGEVMQVGDQGPFLVLLREGPIPFERRLTQAAARVHGTKREMDVLRWLVLGDSNKEIALRLECHEASVERHITSLLRKARCDSRSRLVAWFWTVN